MTYNKCQQCNADYPAGTDCWRCKERSALDPIDCGRCRVSPCVCGIVTVEFPAVKDNGLPVLKDSGHREGFATGAQRDSRVGKGRYDLLPPRALRLLAKHFEAGAVKYDDRNWEKGQPISRYYDSLLRHLNSFLAGDSDEDHAVSAFWNLAALIETRERIAEGFLPESLNDLPPQLIPIPKP